MQVSEHILLQMISQLTSTGSKGMKKEQGTHGDASSGLFSKRQFQSLALLRMYVARLGMLSTTYVFLCVYMYSQAEFLVPSLSCLFNP